MKKILSFLLVSVWVAVLMPVKVNAEKMYDFASIILDTELNAENLSVTTEERRADVTSIESYGGSFYTVEFTYGELQYVLEGDEKVELTTILDAVGIKGKGEISTIEGSDDELFKPLFDEEEKVWYIEALKAFSTEEWLKVTIDGIEYEIVVTDDQMVTTWAELKSALSGDDGTITLGANVAAEVENSTINVVGTKTLDLNGYVINAVNMCGVISVGSGATLTIDDSNPTKEHYFKVGSNNVWKWDDSKSDAAKSIDSLTARAVVNDVIAVTGGCITGGNAGCGSGIYLNSNSKLVMNAGNIVGNNSTSGGNSGVVIVSLSAEFTMNGGRICGNATANCGGGVENGGIFVLNDGMISDNYAANNNGSAIQMNSSSASTLIKGGIITRNEVGVKYSNAGGAVHICNGSFKMTGGIITGNVATEAKDGGVTIQGATSATIGGTAKIIDNMSGGKENNLYLYNNNKVNIGTGIEAPISDMKVGLTLINGTGVFTTQTATVDATNCFFADDRSKGVLLNEDRLEIVDGHAHNNITFMAWSDSDKLPTTAGSYYLTNDVNLSSYWEVPYGTVNLCLNGHVIKRTSGTGQVIQIGSGRTLNLYDCDDTEHYGHIDGTSHLWVSDVTKQSANISIYGGYITGGTVAGTGIGAGVNNEGGTFNMHGGNIVGCKGYFGGGVRNSSNATFFMDGGTITGCACPGTSGQGGAICLVLTSEATVTGNAKIESCLAEQWGGAIDANSQGNNIINISGNCVIQNCVVTGPFSGNHGGGAICAYGDSIINISGGTITGCSSHQMAGAIMCDGWDGAPQLNISGGIITNNTAQGDGGAICLKANNKPGVKMKMTGGIISNNVAQGNGGAVCLMPISSNKASAEIAGGEITNNTANIGGAVYVPSSTEFNMQAGNISNNKALSEGGGVVSDGIITIGGTAIITGNELGNDENNLYMRSGKVVTLSSPTTGMGVGVTLATGKGNITAVNSNSNDYAKYFTSDKAEYIIFKDITQKNIRLIASEDVKALNVDTNIVYDSVQAAVNGAEANQTIQMLNDSTENVTIGKNIILDLNGKVLKANGESRVITVNSGATLTVKDSDTNAIHKGTVSDNGYFWTWDEGTNTGETEIKGGLITGGNITSGTDGGAGVRVEQGATFNLESGSIVGNTHYQMGSNPGSGAGVFVKGIFNMTGGAISYNKINLAMSQWGGGVKVLGTFNMSGGVISHCQSHVGGGVMVVSGEFNMSGSALITDCISNYGGGVHVQAEKQSVDPVFNMTGGIIQNCETKYNNGGGGLIVNKGTNKATANITSGKISDNIGGNGGVYNLGGILNLNGDVEISGNKGKNAGGVYNDGTLTIGGTVNITGNTLSNGTTNNLYLPSGRTVSIEADDGKPTEGMTVGVTTAIALTASTPVAITSDYGADYISYFVSDNSDYAIKSVGNVLKLMKAGAITNNTAESAKDTNHGYIAIDKTTAFAGETVEVTAVMPNTGYSLKSLKYGDTSIEKDTSGKYCFTMPNADVEVTAVFEHIHNFTYSVDSGSAHILKATCIEGCPDGYYATPLTLTLTKPSNLAYDGNAKEISFASEEKTKWEATGTGLGEVPAIVYAAKTGSELTDSKPVNVGEYTASITVNNVTATLDFEITKVASSVTEAPVANSLTYNSNDRALVSAGTASGGTMNYAIGNDGTTAPTSGWSTSIPTGKNAGDYYVWYKSVGDKDHSDTAPVCITVTIAKKSIDVTGGITATNRAYVKDDKTVTLVTANATLSGKVNEDDLSVTATGEMEDDSAGENKKVIIKDLTLTGTAKDNYVLGDGRRQTKTTVTITKSTPEAPTGLESVKPTAIGGNDGKITGTTTEMEYSATTDFASAIACEGTEILNLSVGTYYVRYKETANTNASAYATVVVSDKDKENFSINISNYDAPFDGQAHGITLTGVPDGATVLYGVEEGVYDKENVSFTDFTDGAKNVFVKVTKEGYNDYFGSGTITIAKKDITNATVGDFAAMTYTGAAQIPSAAVTIEGLTVTGTWSEVTNPEDETSFTANGNFTGILKDYATGMTAPAPDGELLVPPEKEKENFSGGGMANSAEELKSMVVSTEDGEEMQKGKDISVWLEVKEKPEITPEETAIVENAMPSEFDQLLKLDVSLWKQVEGQEANKVTEVSNGAIIVKFTVPAELRKDNREFKVLKIHGDKAEILDAVYSAEDGHIVFRTSSFSTYILIYRDKEDKPVEVYYAPLVADLRANENGTIIWEAGDGLPLEAVRLLVEKPELSLEFTFTYENEEHTIFIPAGAFEQYYDVNIPWYGPAWLIGHFEKAEKTVIEYTIVKDDTLNDLSVKFGCTVEEILALNPYVTDSHWIYPNNKLLIPVQQ